MTLNLASVKLSGLAFSHHHSIRVTKNVKPLLFESVTMYYYYYILLSNLDTETETEEYLYFCDR